MYRNLRWLARRSYHQRGDASPINWIKLIIKQQDKRIMLLFCTKPPSTIRNYLRVSNFRWSRKYHYWHSYLNKPKIACAKKLYQFMHQRYKPQN